MIHQCHARIAIFLWTAFFTSLLMTGFNIDKRFLQQGTILGSEKFAFSKVTSICKLEIFFQSGQLQGYIFHFKFQNTYWEFELSRNDSRMRLLGLGPYRGRVLILKFLRSFERKNLVASPTPSWIFWAKCNYWATLMPHLSPHSSLYDYVFFFWRTKSEIMS